MATEPKIRVGVAGLEHDHGLMLAARLRLAGAAIVAYDSSSLRDTAVMRLLGPRARPRTTTQIIEADDVDLVVTAAIPSERAEIGIRALRSGKHVVVDKPGVTTLEQLEAIDRAVTESGRRWWVVFGERFENRAVAEACERARLGDIGNLVSVLGLGPHRLAAASRPDWFWEPTHTGGIIVDIGAHQADQFIAATGSHSVEVATSAVGNVANPRHPRMEDIGMMVLQGNGAVGTHRIDFLSPSGLNTWGDGRLMIVGTEGTFDVRTNVDIAGKRGSAHLIAVDRNGVRRISCKHRSVDWAGRILSDIRTGDDTFLSHEHTRLTCDVTLRAQHLATGWPAREESKV